MNYKIVGFAHMAALDKGHLLGSGNSEMPHSVNLVTAAEDAFAETLVPNPWRFRYQHWIAVQSPVGHLLCYAGSWFGGASHPCDVRSCLPTSADAADAHVQPNASAYGSAHVQHGLLSQSNQPTVLPPTWGRIS